MVRKNQRQKHSREGKTFRSTTTINNAIKEENDDSEENANNKVAIGQEYEMEVESVEIITPDDKLRFVCLVSRKILNNFKSNKKRVNRL